MSFPVLAIGPTVSIVLANGCTPLISIELQVGLRPTIPHIEEGFLIEPPESVPNANGTRYPPTADPDPLEDPPAVLLKSQGLLAGLSTPENVGAPIANSCVCNFPI